jgi:hypothetical protein
MQEFHEQIGIQRSQRLAAADQLNARSQRYVAGKETLDILLEAQRVFAVALQNEYAAIRDYNNALAAFEFTKGTLLQRDNVAIAEGQLPLCAQKRAVEHERERSAAITLRERANPVSQPCWNSAQGCMPGSPQLPANDAAPVASLPVPEMLKDKAPLPDITAQGASAPSAAVEKSPMKVLPPSLPAGLSTSSSSGSTGVLMMEVPVTQKSIGPLPASSTGSDSGTWKMP